MAVSLHRSPAARLHGVGASCQERTLVPDPNLCWYETCHGALAPEGEMTADGDRARRLELGEFLKAQRARLTPDLFGLAAGPRRRTPGLRREEVAQLSGLSTTWYTWL